MQNNFLPKKQNNMKNSTSLLVLLCVLCSFSIQSSENSSIAVTLSKLKETNQDSPKTFFLPSISNEQAICIAAATVIGGSILYYFLNSSNNRENDSEPRNDDNTNTCNKPLINSDIKTTVPSKNIPTNTTKINTPKNEENNLSNSLKPIIDNSATKSSIENKQDLEEKKDNITKYIDNTHQKSNTDNLSLVATNNCDSTKYLKNLINFAKRNRDQTQQEEKLTIINNSPLQRVNFSLGADRNYNDIIEHVTNGNVNKLKTMLETYTNLDINTIKDKYQRTLAIIAVLNDQHQVLSLLINTEGFDPHRKDFLNKDLFEYAFSSKRYKCLQVLLEILKKFGKAQVSIMLADYFMPNHTNDPNCINILSLLVVQNDLIDINTKTSKINKYYNKSILEIARDKNYDTILSLLKIPEN